MLISSRLIIFLIVLLAVKGYISYGEYQPKNFHSNAVYKEYMTILAGEITDEKRQYIADERTMINETLSKHDNMRKAYINEEIMFDEYYEYLSDYNYAYSRNEYLSVIEKHVAYIDSKAEEGIDAWFVYDTGWRNLFFIGFDWTMYAALLFLFAGIFANEYEDHSSSGGFVQILRVSKNGRRKTFTLKLISSIVIASIVSTIWNTLDLIFIYRVYDMPQSNAPLQSIEAFGGIDLTQTIGGYLVLFYAIRITAAIMLALFICSLSAVLRKNITVMTVVVALTIFPALFRYFGTDLFKYVDYTSFMRSTPVLLLGMDVFIIFLSVTALLCAFLTVYAERLWNK